METELYKIRSLGGCLKAALDLYRTNIRTIFRRTWLPATLLAIVGGAAVMLTAITSTNLLVATAAKTPLAPSVLPSVFGIVALSLLAYAAFTWLYAIIVSLLNGESVKHNLPRIVRLVLLALGIGIALVVVVSVVNFAPLAAAKTPTDAMKVSTASTLVTLAISLVMVVVCIPLAYSTMKYCMEGGQKLLSIFEKPYLCGWRHWGYLFMVILLCCIIIAIINLIVDLPGAIVSLSMSLDAAGTMLGDPSGLPGYLDILAFCTFAIADFITVYVFVWYVCVIYYAYGHIEAKEKAKKETLPQAEEVTETKQDATTEPDFEEIK